MTKIPREKMLMSMKRFMGGILEFMMKGRGMNSMRMSELMLKAIWIMQ